MIFMLITYQKIKNLFIANVIEWHFDFAVRCFGGWIIYIKDYLKFKVIDKQEYIVIKPLRSSENELMCGGLIQVKMSSAARLMMPLCLDETPLPCMVWVLPLPIEP